MAHTERTLDPSTGSLQRETRARVSSKSQSAEGVVSLELVAVDASPLPKWDAGAHVDLMIDGVATRQYSLCGDVDDRGCYRLGVLREAAGRGGSAYVHDVLRPGQRLRVGGPRNHFRLEASPSYVFVAGGIGITPILPMIAAAEAAGARWSLLYGGRTSSSMAYTDLLSRHGDRVTIRPQDVHGLLDLAALLGTPREDTLVYCCGPEPLIAAVERQCATWPDGALHVERFAAPEQPVRDPADEHAVEVVLRTSGRTVLVPPDQPVLDALLGAGVDILSDCREGICGTCEVGVVEGDVDHRDFILTEKERTASAFMMVCVSRARSARLVLDL